MREFKFDLSKHKKIKGELVLGIPSYRQRLMMIKECSFKMSDKGEVEVGAETIDSIVKLLDISKPYFKKVELECGDIKVKSFDEMEEYAEFDTLLTEASSSILNAGRLGK